MRWFARFLLKQVAAGSWVSQIRRSVGRRGAAFKYYKFTVGLAGSRRDLKICCEFCENQVGQGEVGIFMVASKFTHLSE